MDAPGFVQSQTAQPFNRPVSRSAARESAPCTGASHGTSPAKATASPSKSSGCTIHSTAMLETIAHALTLRPRSTSTGKVAAEAQAAIQALSARPCKRSGSLLNHGRLTGFCRFSPALIQKRLSWASRIRRMQAEPATVPATAAKESSKPISHTA